MQYELFRHPSYLSPLSYVGSKKKLYRTVALYILRETPAELVSPFCGGCNLELRFAASGTRVYASDIFRPVIEFFQLFNGRSAEIIEKVLSIYPLEREHYERMRADGGWEGVDCPIERAAITWAMNKQSFMSQTFSSTPVSPKNAISIGVFSQPEWAGWYNGNITFALKDFRCALAEHPSALAYLDPPYVKKEDYYGRGDQGKFPHEELRDILNERDNWIMSYGDHEVIRELYAGYKILKLGWGYGYGQAAGKPENSSEILILSHDVEHRRKKPC